MKLSLSAAILALVCMACSKGGEPPKAAETETQAPPPPPPAPECVGEDNEVVECETDAECCKGFVCAKDPEQNHRLKYCMYPG